MKVPRLGTESELKLRPTPQPQQHGIWTAGVTYATAWSNTGSLTHWARPGIKTVISEWSRLKKQDLFSFLLFSPSMWKALLSSSLYYSSSPPDSQEWAELGFKVNWSIISFLAWKALFFLEESKSWKGFRERGEGVGVSHRDDSGLRPRRGMWVFSSNPHTLAPRVLHFLPAGGIFLRWSYVVWHI